MHKKIFLLGCLILSLRAVVTAQELQARISVNAQQISSQTDRKIFSTLQSALNNLLNNRKWTSESFQPNEKIVCNFMLRIGEAVGNNTYKAALTVQAARPVFNSNYETPLINFQDENVTFKYVEYQQVEFNENRVAGTDALASNLTAVIAYYVYLILALDFDSFSLRGGDPYFQKVQNIVNNAPEARDIAGWKAFDGLRNRYWLMENFTNNRYVAIHDVLYNYYRQGMDFMYENETQGRASILNALTTINTLNNNIPNTMVVQFFFQGKSNELIKIFKKATPEDKAKAREILTKIDISNANTYRSELK